MDSIITKNDIPQKLKEDTSSITQSPCTVGRERKKHLECDGNCLLWVDCYLKQSYKGRVRTKYQ